MISLALSLWLDDMILLVHRQSYFNVDPYIHHVSSSKYEGNLLYRIFYYAILVIKTNLLFEFLQFHIDSCS